MMSMIWRSRRLSGGGCLRAMSRYRPERGGRCVFFRTQPLFYRDLPVLSMASVNFLTPRRVALSRARPGLTAFRSRGIIEAMTARPTPPKIHLPHRRDVLRAGSLGLFGLGL